MVKAKEISKVIVMKKFDQNNDQIKINQLDIPVEEYVSKKRSTFKSRSFFYFLVNMIVEYNENKGTLVHSRSIRSS